jgi:hypothetical protein
MPITKHENETKRNETKRNETKRNETKTKQIKKTKSRRDRATRRESLDCKIHRRKSIIFDTVPCLKSITRDGSYVTSTTRASRREGRLKKTRAGEGDADERDRANEDRHD